MTEKRLYTVTGEMLVLARDRGEGGGAHLMREDTCCLCGRSRDEIENERASREEIAHA